MRRSFQWTIILGVLLALTLGVAAEGGDANRGSHAQGENQGTPAEGQPGCKVTARGGSEGEKIDPRNAD